MTAFPPNLPDDLDDPDVIRENDWQAFRSLAHMDNHWNRPDWADGRSSYHWLLDCSVSEAVRQLAEHCQAQLDRRVFDPVPQGSLHVTLGRVAFTDEIARAAALAAANAAAPRCAELSPFTLTIGPLAGSRGALRFTVAPWTPLLAINDRLVVATSAVFGEQIIMDGRNFRPHLSIAYAHTSVPMPTLLPVLKQLRKLPTIAMDVRSVALVELHRVGRTYRYNTLVSLPARQP